MLLVLGALHAQVSRFEVASIKPSAPGGTPSGTPRGVIFQGCVPPFGSTPSRLQYILYNCTVRDLVRRAWSLSRPFEFSFPSDPAWASSVRYDIAAKSAAPVNPIDHGLMLQSLLEDRFKLKWHREKKELPVYYLSLSKGGLKLPATAPGSCTPWDKKSPPPPPYPDKPPTCDYILMPQSPDGLGLGMDGTGVPISSLASRLTDLLGRLVVDKTGFTGTFNLHIKFARDSSLALGGIPEQGGQASDPAGLPNIFSVIRKIGLTIESGKGPVDVFVMDSVQRPSEN